MDSSVDSSIALGVKVPNVMTTLGSMLDVRQRMQNLQTGQIQQQRQGVGLQQEQGALDARSAISQVSQDPAMRDPETGLIDLNKFVPAVQAADPRNYLWQDVVAKTAAVNSDMMKVKSLGMQLGDQATSYVGQRLGALAQDPNVTKDDVNQALDDTERIAGAGSPAVKPFADIVRRTVSGLDKPGTVAPVLAKIRNMAFSIPQQVPQTALPSTGTTIQPTQVNPLFGAVAPNAPPIQMQVPPGQQETMGTDVTGGAVVIPKSPAGVIGAPRPVAGAQAPPMMSFPPGENAGSQAMLTDLRAASNQAAAKVPDQHFNNQQIIRLASQGYSGSTAGAWAKLFSANGLQAIPGDATANYQQLGHFMALQSQANAKAMGVQNIPGQLTAEAASGSTNWTPTAIQRATLINDANATGVGLFNQGMERAVNDPNNTKGIFAARDFQNKWSSTYDVDAMRLHNAIQNGDTAEQNSVIQSVGGKNSPGAKRLAAKMQALDALISGR